TRPGPAALVGALERTNMPISLPAAPDRSRLPHLPESLPDRITAPTSGAEVVTADGRSLPLVSATLRGTACGGLARLVLEQRFENRHAETLHVTYRMPLPADGAVSGYAFVIADRTIAGRVQRKQEARERFERAIVQGKTAALLEQERADIFTQQIGNIPPREAVVARITIDQRLVWLPEGEWELRFPTVIGPRYIGSADTIHDANATHVKVTNRPLGITFQIGIRIGDAITGGAKPTSPSHTLAMKDGVTELHSGTRLDRDIVVRWPVAAAEPGLALNVARRERGDAFGLVTIVPPARAAKAKAVPRDLLVLLDTSGSMGGGPLDKAKQVVALMIDSLAETDRLELIEFSNEPSRWQEEPALATPSTKQAAIKWVRSREASGGTEMRAAVIESLATLRIGAQRQVLLVTDGYVGGEQQILEVLHRKLPQSCRLHVLGVGSAVNRSLATALARAGRGAEVLVGLDEDAERGAKRLLDRTKLPMLTNVELAGSALLRHAPEKLPDVFEGAPLVAALAVKPEGGELVVRGQVAGETWTQTIKVPAKQLGEGNQAIAALYGRERVADVEAHGMFSTVDGEIEELGLEFQIATRMTSWVAVDESRIVKGPSHEELVPQELPYGTSAAAFGLRGVVQPESGMDMLLGAPRAMPAAAPMRSYAPTGAPPRSPTFGYSDPENAPRGGGGPFAGTRTQGGMRKTESASFDVGEEDFESEVATGEVESERARSIRFGEDVEDEKVAPPPRAPGYAPLAKTVVAGKAPASPPVDQPTQPSPAGPQSVMPAKPMAQPEPMQPMAPPLAQPEARAKKRKNQLALAIAILIAAILALLWWLIG
ncbi:MAG TPA: VIT domain-containing protein, partial [Kofleriaceae bacterium]